MISQIEKIDSSISRIRNIVLATLVFTFFAIGMVRSLTLWSQHDEVISSGQERAQNLALMIGDHLVRTIESIDGSLIQISQYASRTRVIPGFVDDLTPLLKQSLGSLRGIGSLTIVNESGIVTHSTVPQIIGKSRDDRFAFRRLQSDPTSQFIADEPFRGLVSKQILIPLARRISLPDGSFAGIIVATLEPERLREFYKAIEHGKKGSIWLLHQEGFVLFRQPTEQTAEERLPPDHPLLAPVAQRLDRSEHGLRFVSDGGRFIGAIHQYSALGIRVAVSLSEEELFADWRRDVRNSLIILLCIALALGFAGFQVSRQVRERLAEAESFTTKSNQYQAILDHAPATITVKDRTGRIVVANRAFQQRVKKDADQIIGQPLNKILPEHYAEQLSALDREVLEKGAVLQRELTSPDQRKYLAIKFPLFALNGEVDGVGSISQDVTDTRAAQTINLRIFENSLDLILITSRNGDIVRVSPSVEKILGYLPEEMERKNAIHFIHPDDLESTRNEMRLARFGTATRNFETRYIHKDGRIVALVWTGVWVEQEAQHFFIGHDMSERIKLEQDLLQSQKMEAIGQLTGGLAHDYNNLLTIILGNAELLTESLHDHPSLLPLAQATVDAADRSAVLTQRLLAFGRRQALAAQPTDMNQLIDGMLDLIRMTVGEQIKIGLELGADPWIVKVDRSQIETAVLNLVINARDAMPAGGTLQIETAKVSFDEEAASVSPDMRAGNFMMLSVSDNGSGMDSETLTRVFEPFFTTKALGKGTGLGLSMVYGFVKQSGGHISIYSEPGIGTSVKLYFPPMDRAGKHVEETSARDQLLTGSESVLLVEDEPMVRASTERQLVLLGYNVISAATGKEALEIFDRGFRPDLLVSDVIMAGGMNGRELAEEMRKRSPALPVLFMSGYTSGVLTSGGGIPQDTNFIGKPFRRNQLAKAVRDAIDAKAPFPA